MSDWQFNYNIDVDKDNRVVFVKIFGVWRLETAENYVREVRQEVEDMTDKPWVKLIDLMNWKMGTPEIVDRLGEYMNWCLKNNMVHQVFVISDPMRFGQLQKMFDKGGVKDVSSTCRTRPEGIKILRDKGFKVID